MTTDDKIPESFDWLREFKAAFVVSAGESSTCRQCGRPFDASETDLRMCRTCLESRAREHRLRELDATIPPHYEWASLDSPLLMERVRSGVPPPDRIDEILSAQRVIFLGETTGCGKTSLAVALLREAARRGADAMFVSAYRLATTRAGHPLGEGDPPLIKAALSVGVLLIDGVDTDQQSALNDVRPVVGERHDFELPIWITTAVSSANLARAYGGGFLRRIAERAVAIDCDAARPSAAPACSP